MYLKNGEEAGTLGAGKSEGVEVRSDCWWGPAHHTKILALSPRQMGSPGGVLSVILFTF